METQYLIITPTNRNLTMDMMTAYYIRNTNRNSKIYKITQHRGCKDVIAYSKTTLLE